MKHFLLNILMTSVITLALSALAAFLFEVSVWAIFGVLMILPTIALARFAYLTK